MLLKCFLTTIVESWRKAKPLLRCVCLSLMRRMLDGDKVAKGARADKIDSREVWGPRFRSIRAVVNSNVKEISRQENYNIRIRYKIVAKFLWNVIIYCHWRRPTVVLPGSGWLWDQRNGTVEAKAADPGLLLFEGWQANVFAPQAALAQLLEARERKQFLTYSTEIYLWACEEKDLAYQNMKHHQI